MNCKRYFNKWQSQKEYHQQNYYHTFTGHSSPSASSKNQSHWNNNVTVFTKKRYNLHQYNVLINGCAKVYKHMSRCNFTSDIRISTIRHWSDMSFTMAIIESSPVLMMVGPNTIARLRTSIYTVSHNTLVSSRDEAESQLENCDRKIRILVLPL